MTKVMVIGNAGGGKSTLCRRLCAVYGLSYTAIDKLQWKSGWVPVSSDAYNRAHDSVISSACLSMRKVRQAFRPMMARIFSL